jgi:hypothetical protein
VRCSGTDDSGNDWGVRFYLSYSGTAPTGANCTTLAGDVAAAWATNLSPRMQASVSLTEVDVLDIATDSGLSGQWNGTDVGGDSGAPLPIQVATNVEYGIARRYRGGKPRCYFPLGTATFLLTQSMWTAAYVTDINTAVTAFFAEIAGLSVGAVGTLTHVNLSYYKGFTNVTNSSGRERAVPTYRAVALVDNITGYSCKQEFGSQKRRRAATSP